MDTLFLCTAAAVAVFAATNIDDLFILVALFAGGRWRARDIAAGQFMGIAVLVAAGLTGALAALVVDPVWLGFLGVAPVLLGVRLLWLGGGEGEGDAPAAQGGAWAVAAVTVAGGGDNIGAYVPLFAAQDASQIVVTVAVFAVLTGAWVALAHWLATHPSAGPPVRRWGGRLLPWVLIGIGGWVIADAGTFALVRSWLG
ncbi:cadmium resistance transporter [Nitrospirillum viridazoti]|uniref:Quaternary ammonium transporter n=1 Tax=Nitrospirillum viridazoti CBAmc TaxID=1441467 RepID=A0A248JW01_9PROT|nr:cadmium resistance transporter [Nitrospirillum amazonense]ASG22700.1 quaternary ammonium transporter [Nitrospirillum amazonense CBAmc]TWB30217.1 cadmium resistance protein CadD (predicted permease) [Nitrospirillum amazonense]